MAVKKNTKEVISVNTTTAMTERAMKEALVNDPLMAEKALKAEKAMKDAIAWAKTESCPDAIKEFILGAKEVVENNIARIKELYAIDATAMKISDIVNAYNLTQSQLECEGNANKAAIEADIQALQNEYEAEKVRIKVEIEEEEAEYTKKRDKQRKADKEEWADQEATLRKEWDAREAEISEKENVVPALESKIAELEAIIAKHPDEIADAVKKAEGKAKAMAESKADTDAKLVETQNGAEIAKLNYKIEVLNGQVEDLKTQRDKALEQAEASAKRLEDVTKAFANAQNATVNVTTTGK